MPRLCHPCGTIVPTIAALLLIWLFCSKLSVVTPVYVPIITFSGIVNTDSLYYPGNRLYPNTCKITANCVRMYFYSENYSHETISRGDQMRIDVYGLDSQFITERHALFDLTRYDDAITTPTYTVVEADTLNTYNNLHIKVESFEKRHGGSVRLTEMSVTARPLGQFNSKPLTIVRGTISGSIE
jgi:hypothetical protein